VITATVIISVGR